MRYGSVIHIGKVRHTVKCAICALCIHGRKKCSAVCPTNESITRPHAFLQALRGSPDRHPAHRSQVRGLGVPAGRGC